MEVESGLHSNLAPPLTSSSSIVKLNVGGARFTTTVATLTSVDSSYFSSLFSGRWKQHLTEVRGGWVVGLGAPLGSSCTPMAAAGRCSRAGGTVSPVQQPQ
jgi:hypothetical protein